jgi:hypothetical protein
MHTSRILAREPYLTRPFSHSQGQKRAVTNFGLADLRPVFAIPQFSPHPERHSALQFALDLVEEAPISAVRYDLVWT